MSEIWQSVIILRVTNVLTAKICFWQFPSFLSEIQRHVNVESYYQILIHDAEIFVPSWLDCRKATKMNLYIALASKLNLLVHTSLNI